MIIVQMCWGGESRGEEVEQRRGETQSEGDVVGIKGGSVTAGATLIETDGERVEWIYVWVWGGPTFLQDKPLPHNQPNTELTAINYILWYC